MSENLTENLDNMQVYWTSEFIALKFGVLSAGIYDLDSRTMPGIEIEQYGILENFSS